MAITEMDYLQIEKGKNRYLLLKSPTHFHLVKLNGTTQKQIEKLRRVYPCDDGTLKKMKLHYSAFRCQSLRRVVLSSYEAGSEITLWIGGEVRKYVLSQDYSEQFVDNFFAGQQRSWLFLKKPVPWVGLDPSVIRKVSLWTNVLCMGIPCWFFFLKEPYRLMAALSVLCQIVPVVLVAVYPESFTILEGGKQGTQDRKPGNLMGAFLVPGFALALRTLDDFTYFDGALWHLALIAFLLWLPMVGALALRSHRIRLNLWECVSLGAILLLLNLGMAGQLNCFLDTAPVKSQTVEVVDMHLSQGSKFTSYYCTVILADGESVDIQVPGRIYRQIEAGDGICIEDHAGAFGIRFLTLGKENGP